ncbi:MAG: peroxiredoxin [Bacteroidales bacterium]
METENYSMPRIGDKAPEFSAVTTQGRVIFPSDYAGKWKILFSHPSDFTPVCTSEFITFASMQEDFDKLNCQLVGLSVDGLFSHIAWLRTIKEKIEFRGMQNVEVTFPLIEDITMEIAQKYGMIQPSESTTKAVRAVFFIDTEDTIRAIIYYPLSLGRNFREIKRVLIGLQTTDIFHVSLPADWVPGEEVIVPSATTFPKAEERIQHPKDSEGVTCHDWFFCTKPLPKDDIKSAIKERNKK